jgi:hypothetical protein
LKLAEGLVLRADTKKRIEQLRDRLRLSALVQEGEEPPENPEELLVELNRLLAQLTDLVQRINRTNLGAVLPDGATLTDALAVRDTLTLHHGVLKIVADAASPQFDRLRQAEIKKVATIKVAALRIQMDEIAKQRRELDTLIQSANWTIELLD